MSLLKTAFLKIILLHQKRKYQSDWIRSAIRSDPIDPIPALLKAFPSPKSRFTATFLFSRKYLASPNGMMEKEQHTAKLQKFLNSTHCKILEWQVMNEKMNSNSMRNMYKNNTSVLIQERARLNVSKNLTICSLMVVFWANVMNEQWQINNLISWKFLFKNP